MIVNDTTTGPRSAAQPTKPRDAAPAIPGSATDIAGGA